MPTVSLQEMVMTMHAYLILSWLPHLPFELPYHKISLDCWQVAQNATANLLTKSSKTSQWMPIFSLTIHPISESISRLQCWTGQSNNPKIICLHWYKTLVKATNPKQRRSREWLKMNFNFSNETENKYILLQKQKRYPAPTTIGN